MNRRRRATFAVGIFEACDVVRKALIELVTLGYQQQHLFLIRPADPDSKEPGLPSLRDVQNLVVPLNGWLKHSTHRVDFNDAKISVGENQDAAIVQDMETWLPLQHFSRIANALHDRHKVLFVRMHEQRQFAPTCSVLLTHCTLQVNTHEVLLPYH